MVLYDYVVSQSYVSKGLIFTYQPVVKYKLHHYETLIFNTFINELGSDWLLRQRRPNLNNECYASLLDDRLLNNAHIGHIEPGVGKIHVKCITYFIQHNYAT